MNVPPSRMHIDRLDVRIRGLSRSTIEAALQSLAPALQRELNQVGPTSAREGVIHVSDRVTAPNLAQLIAHRVVSSGLGRAGSPVNPAPDSSLRASER